MTALIDAEKKTMQTLTIASAKAFEAKEAWRKSTTVQELLKARKMTLRAGQACQKAACAIAASIAVIEMKRVADAVSKASEEVKRKNAHED